MKILVTGSAGFICGYVVEELLNHGHEVVGIDNFSKYGEVKKSYDNHPNYHFTKGDAKDTELMKELSPIFINPQRITILIGRKDLSDDEIISIFKARAKTKKLILRR